MKKGMSIPIETVVILVIAVIVLAALLLFFGGTFGPGVDSIKLEQKKSDLCGRYALADPDCKLPPSDKIKADMEKTCKDMGLSTNPSSCCAGLCGGLKCEEKGLLYSCIPREDCGIRLKGSPVGGICEKPNDGCCKAVQQTP